MIIYQPKATRPSFHTFLFGCNVSPPVSASTGFTPSGTDPQVYTCYDKYATPSTWGTAYNYSQVYTDHIQTDNVKGLVTGVKAKVLGTTTWACTVNYYDKYGKLIQSYQSNPEGGYNRTTMAYNFTEQPIKQQVYHKKTSTSTPITTEERYIYDHMGRPLTSTHSYNGWNFFTIAQNTYDELGRTAKKELHNGFQDIDYQYNIRGWLTRINDPITIGGNKLFAMELFYDTDMSAALSGGPQFNGNINGIKWRNYNNGLLTWKGYNFTYDGLNRLKQGDYGTYTTGWNNTNTYDLSGVTYDLNGNISTMNCKNSAGGDKENLTYTYAGNQLTSVTGTYNSVTGKTGGFTYDANGNGISDGLRGLASVSYYDEIDLPKQYFKDANNKVDYQYDAMGNKWGKTATISGTPSTMNYYGQFIYQGNTLSKVLTPEGFFDPVTYMYHYYLKDHLGNTRITFCYSGSTPIVAQEVEYYPFGAMFAQNNLDKNTYLYNGKELNNEFFENYDYGARFYDPTIGRFHTLDPKAEAYSFQSPFAYAANNPIKFVDVNGAGPGFGPTFIPVTNLPTYLKMATYTDLNDVVVLISSLLSPITGKGPINIDGTPASHDDVEAAEMGIFMPVISGSGAKKVIGAIEEGLQSTEVVERAMSKAELKATKDTGLLRGGREGTHYASDAVNNTAKDAKKRLALPVKPEVKATLEVPSGKFSTPSKVEPKFGEPGGGMQRTATGDIPTKVLKVEEYKK